MGSCSLKVNERLSPGASCISMPSMVGGVEYVGSVRLISVRVWISESVEPDLLCRNEGEGCWCCCGDRSILAGRNSKAAIVAIAGACFSRKSAVTRPLSYSIDPASYSASYPNSPPPSVRGVPSADAGDDGTLGSSPRASRMRRRSKSVARTRPCSSSIVPPN